MNDVSKSVVPDAYAAMHVQNHQAFLYKILPAPLDGGFAMKDYWVWCGSVIAGPDGRYHMYASRWSKSLAFRPHWLTNSEIVHAVSDTPQGPYEYAQTILPARGEEYWDGRMTHNPSVCYREGQYLLYYTGTTYSGPTPTPDNPLDWESSAVWEARGNQRVGVAIASDPSGPWQRMDKPILMPRADHWDNLMTTNPAPCVCRDGSILLIYKSAGAVGEDQYNLRFGVASADTPLGPYTRLQDEPIFNLDTNIEDPFVWESQPGRYEMIMKVFNDKTTGEANSGLHAFSTNGIDWQLSNPSQAYSRKVQWEDQSVTIQHNFERPQLLLKNGKPTHLYAATSVLQDGTEELARTWNMVVPLKS